MENSGIILETKNIKKTFVTGNICFFGVSGKNPVWCYR